MARAIWTGAISFGLVTVPVRLYTATSSHRPTFHQFKRGTGQRIRNRRVTEDTGEVVDYDTIVKLDPTSWRVVMARHLQGKSWQGANQFIGDIWFNGDETMCVVARPFSADVIVIDPENLKTRFQCQTRQQPLQAVAFADGAVVARDWKTGTLLRGKLKRAGLFSWL